jgi:ABC-type sugar transport system ATPase subunit
LDISAKGEILKLATNLANTGVSILFISSELEELMTISDRYLILSERHVVAELPGSSTQDSLISALSKVVRGNAA